MGDCPQLKNFNNLCEEGVWLIIWTTGKNIVKHFDKRKNENTVIASFDENLGYNRHMLQSHL